MTSTPSLSISHFPAEPGNVREITVCETIRHAAATVPDRLALVDFVEDSAARREWTYAEFLADIERVARALLERFEPGDRIAIWAPNSAEWVILQQGIIMAGMVVVALNPAYRAREVSFVLEQSGSSAVFVVDEHRGFDMRGMVEDIRPELPQLREVISFSAWEDFIASGDPTRPLSEPGPYDLIHVQYTSGTTGFPKGAMLHHMGLVNEATFVAERAGMSDGGVYVNAMPMYHIGGGAVTSFGAWSERGTFVLLPGFDPAQVMEAFEAYRGTHSLLVPTMLLAILNHPDLHTRDLSSIQTVLSGASAVPASLVRRTTETLNCQFTILFGQTETHGVITQTRVWDSPEDQSETVGQPLPQLEVKIADLNTGEPVALGEQGEICCRGYQNMQGYYNLPAETAETIDRDGWLHMGDLGAMDDRGFVKVTGRIKDMIIRGGMNLYPAEIEHALEAHPALSMVSVIGLPDEKWGEQIAAIVTLAPGADAPSPDDLSDFLKGQLAPHKTPVYWAFVDALPMTTTGKVQKFALREQAAAGGLTFVQRTASAWTN